MDIFLDVLLSLFISTIVIQFFFAFIFFIRLSVYKKRKELIFSEGVSVIICAKDEAENLARNLTSFLDQDYHKYEVIVVNDQSNDGTKFILQDFEKRYNNLKVVNIEDHVNSRIGKKFALTIGVKTAKFDYLLLSDADCKTSSKRWIRNMSAQFLKKDIILGVSPYQKQKGLLNMFIRFDEFQVSLQYLSFALAGIPYMGVGRNLAYKKSLFFSVKGFASHMHIPSGDDDLFIKEVATKDNTGIQIDKQSDIMSVPKDTFASWMHQKRRHLTTSKLYHIKHKILLLLWPLSQFLFWFSIILLLIFTENLILVLSLFSARILLYYAIYYKAMQKLRSSDLYFFYPIIEFFHLFLQLFFVLLDSVYKVNNWK